MAHIIGFIFILGCTIMLGGFVTAFLIDICINSHRTSIQIDIHHEIEYIMTETLDIDIQLIDDSINMDIIDDKIDAVTERINKLKTQIAGLKDAKMKADMTDDMKQIDTEYQHLVNRRKNKYHTMVSRIITKVAVWEDINPIQAEHLVKHYFKQHELTAVPERPELQQWIHQLAINMGAISPIKS